MKKYVVQYRVSSDMSVEFEASNDSEAWEISGEKARTHARTHAPPGFRVTVSNLRQTGEPWVRGDWYDLHGPGDVMVFWTAMGNGFLATDRELLATRLRAEGFTIEDAWNGGEGSSSVSFRVSNRAPNNPMLTDEQKARICAPRDRKDT